MDEKFLQILKDAEENQQQPKIERIAIRFNPGSSSLERRVLKNGEEVPYSRGEDQRRPFEGDYTAMSAYVGGEGLSGAIKEVIDAARGVKKGIKVYGHVFNHWYNLSSVSQAMDFETTLRNQHLRPAEKPVLKVEIRVEGHTSHAARAAMVVYNAAFPGRFSFFSMLDEMAKSREEEYEKLPEPRCQESSPNSVKSA